MCTLTCFGSWRLVEIMQECKCTFWCVHQILSSASSFPVGRNIICRLSPLFRMKLPCYVVPLPAHVCAAVSTYTCTVPVCHRLLFIVWGGTSKSCLINCPQSRIACEQNHWNMTFKVDLCWHFHYISTALDAFWKARYEKLDWTGCVHLPAINHFTPCKRQ